MASPNPYAKRRSPPSLAREPPPVSAGHSPPRSSCTSSFLCKSVFFALFLLALPLFPSQAPDFVGETVFTKFWELIHLLFVGIAVSYGLFSRRNADSGVDLQARASSADESSLSYVSRMFHVSSFFDYESEFDERNENRSIKVSIPSSENKSGPFDAESPVDDSFEYGKINQVQAWNSQYFQGRSKLVVAQPSYGIEDYTGHKPLGLPVRSLRSALRETQDPEGNCLPGDYDGAVRENFGSFSSVELEEKFDEVRAPSSPVPRQSRSERVTVRDSLRGGTYPSNFTPLPVDEPQFETFKSGSFRSTSSSSSQASFVSHTQSRFSPSHSVSAESLNSNVEEMAEEQSLQGSSRSSSPSLSSSPSPSPPSPKSVTDDTYRRLSHSRHYSEGSLFEEDGRRGFEEELDGGNLGGRKTAFLIRKELGSKSLKLTGEDFRKGSSSRKSYPPDSVSPPLGADNSPARWPPQQKICDSLFEDTVGGSWEDPDHLRGKLRSNSQKRLGVSQGSVETGTEGHELAEKLRESSPPRAPSSLKSAKVSSNAMNARPGGCDSSSDKDVKRNSEDDSADFGRSRRRDRFGDKELKAGTALRWESNSGKAGNKCSVRGKSVRTVRLGRYAKDLNGDGESSDGLAEHLGKTKSRSHRQDDASNETSQEKLGDTRAKSKPRYFEEQNGKGKQASKSYMMKHDDRNHLEPEEKEAEQPRASVEEESARGSVSDAGTDPNEVDRKAGEFIAKFREQIRLQKLLSGELPRGIGNISGSHFR